MRFRVGALTLFLAGAFLAAPLAADAQQAERIPRIGQAWARVT
jgi:hypothetical protein